jgi:hypothetical protein
MRKLDPVASPAEICAMVSIAQQAPMRIMRGALAGTAAFSFRAGAPVLPSLQF